MKRTLILLALLVSSISLAQVTLSYALWDNNQLPAHRLLADFFEAEHPDIKIDIQVVPWVNYWDKLQVAVAGGNAYDVFWMNGANIGVFSDKGVLLELTDLIAADGLDVSVYPAALLELYRANEAIYGLPKDLDTIALFYNADLFRQAGIAPPDDSWTWDTLQTVAAQLTGDGIWGFAATPADQAGYWNFIYQNEGEVLAPDGSHVLIDSPAACDAINYLYSFVKAGSSPDGATMQAVDPWTGLFPAGRVAMVTGGSWLARTYADASLNIGVAPLPTGKQRASVVHGLANVIWSGTAHPEAAWDFVKFLSSEQAATILAQSGTVIPAYSSLQGAWTSSIPSMDLQVFIDALDYGVTYPTAAEGLAWNTEISNVLGDLWAGNASLEGVCARAASAANAILEAQ